MHDVIINENFSATITRVCTYICFNRFNSKTILYTTDYSLSRHIDRSLAKKKNPDKYKLNRMPVVLLHDCRVFFPAINRKITFTVLAILGEKKKKIGLRADRLARVIRAFFRIGRRNIVDERRFIGSAAALRRGRERKRGAGERERRPSVQDIDDK